MSQVSRKIGMDLPSLAKYVSELVAKESGNILGNEHQEMVRTRLQKRLIDLGSISPAEYYEYLEENSGEELQELTSLLTTHHTFFFREFSHFEFLLTDLARLVDTAKKRGDSTIRIYSAACSRGQEAYSLAMFFEKHLVTQFPGVKYEIFGTDIDRDSVNFAANGVYPYRDVKSIPQLYLSGNWQRGTGDIAKFARVKPHLKEKCEFKVANLLSIDAALGKKQFDVIFCRNVFIYFDKKDVIQVAEQLKKHLVPGGLFVSGLSESLQQFGLNATMRAPSVYVFDVPKSAPVQSEPEKGGATSAKVVQLSDYKKPAAPQSPFPQPIRMLCVDDSKPVLKLLTKIFEADPAFQLVGTAENGIEASEFLKKNAVDAMTLDIHMPEQDGVEYLRKNFGPKHPKVVVVSSASREDTRYAQKTIELGAADFVEKPALNNIKNRAEEIKSKIKMAFMASSGSPARIKDDLTKDFSSDFAIKDAGKKARILSLSFSQLSKAVEIIKSLRGEQPPVYLLFEGNDSFLAVIQESLAKALNKTVKISDQSDRYTTGDIVVCDSAFTSKLHSSYGEAKVSLGIIGDCSPALLEQFLNFKNAQFLIDEALTNKAVLEIADDKFPTTSFGHVGTEYLAKD